MNWRDDVDAGLTPGLLKEILQIVPSDRRTFAEYFDFIDKSERMNDDLFYSALLDRIQTSDDWCRSLEAAFQKSAREKERQRAPSMKIGKWLRNNVPSFGSALPEGESVADGKIEEILATMTPLQRQVFDLAGRFGGGKGKHQEPVLADAVMDNEGVGMKREPMPVAAEKCGGGEPTWMTLRDRLRSALDGLTEADTDAASDILNLAKDLQVACAEHQREAAARDRLLLQGRRATLLAALDSLADLPGGADLLAKVGAVDDPDILDRAEEAVAPLLAAVADLDVAAVALADAAGAERDARADQGLSRPEVRAAMDRLDRTEAAEQTARSRLEATLQDTLRVLDFSRTPPAEIPAVEAEELVAKQDVQVRLPEDTVPERPEEPIAEILPRPEQEPAAEPLLPEALAGGTPEAEAEELARLAAIFEDPPESPVEPDPSEAEVDLKDESVAVWTGRKSLDDLLADYLDRGEAALAWHLADLAEEAGHIPPIPPLLIRALAAGPAIAGPYDQSTQAMGELLAAAMSALERAEEAGPVASQRARGIALAALIRPALMARDTNARDLLANLRLPGTLSGYAGVVASLTGLRHDLQPGIAELAALAGVEKQRRVPQALADIQDWLPRARAAQGPHAPSNTILHILLSAGRDLGGLFEAVLRDDLHAVEHGLDFLQRLAGGRAFAEQLISAEEKALNRPRSDAIRGTALDWICRRLHDGAELVLRWRTARHEDGIVDDRRKEDLRRHVSGLRKELERVAGGADADSGLDAAVQRCVNRAVRDLITILDGQAGNTVAIRISDALDLALLRLPGDCQPCAPDDDAYATERMLQRSRLLAALSAPETVAADEVTALRQHLADHALRPARQILDRLQRDGTLSEAELAGMRQELEEAHHAAVAQAESRIRSLRHEMEPLQSIDLSTSQEIQRWLDRLSLILAALSRRPEAGPVLPMRDGQRVPDIPADFPQLAGVLDDGRQLRDSVRAQIMQEQEGRLRSLVDRYQAEGRTELADQADQIIATLGDRDLLTVEDLLIRLQNGQNPALSDEDEEDHFSRFYPGFVLALNSADVGGGKIPPAIDSGGILGPLDFSVLDEGERKRSGQLFENWRALKNAMNPNRTDLGQSLRQFMERLGFTSVGIERETVLSAQLRTMRMRCDELTAQRWFLPPAFGSEARGSYPVFLASGNIDDEQVTRELAKVGRDAPCILLVFGTLTKARRENFALAMRRAKQTVLLIDEAQVLFLAMGTSWMERLFSCGAPFGYLQPYTTSAGRIPAEMFFGREEEIANIESATTDGCLVYGGRQLGKSALLHHVRKRFHQPLTGRHAYYLKIDEYGGQVQAADQIWSLIRRELASDQILSRTAENADDIRDGIRDWLDRSGERRILLLIDEADMFLASEVRSGFPNLNRLKDMMESSARRFKVVFAGLHNVQRMAKAPNSPLVHLGKPICIGPMNTTSKSSLQARRLVTEPMRAAGFAYASPDLVQAVLTRVNYYPSLVQVFCKALLEGISNQPRPRGQGPRWVLEKDNLFGSNEDINDQIRERFQWTLNLDPRYELIAKVLALYRLDSAERDGGAMAPQAITREVEGFWPRGFERLPPEDFRAFLDEMVDLGVLIRLGPGMGTYGLRGAQVAQMLGQREQLEHEILQIAEKEPRVDYDASFYHRRSRPDQSDRRSPLSDNALQKLFDTDLPGLRFLAAPPGIWGTDVARAVAELAEGWQDKKGLLAGTMLTGAEDELRRQVERGNGRRVLVIPAGSKGASKWAAWLAERDQVRQGNVLPVFVGSHEQIAQVRPTVGSGIPAQVFHARPWERNMLRAWLVEAGLQALDTAECRDALLEISGGSPFLLGELRPQLEALVSGRRSEGIGDTIRQMGGDFDLKPAEAGLPASLVPEFCTAVELLQLGEERSVLVELLVGEGNADADQDLRLMERLGLFHRPDPQRPEWIACSALGALVFKACERPVRGGGR
ncbi:AAA family ATPase [Tabrizicola soli]|uniref:AAA family ATPase n=1 Tax=Tabrizicola soli TaxID=2185115 RepID=A0ABV7DUD8_9RHOB|nr:AAA family ATPase [Tabrizicola soli]